MSATEPRVLVLLASWQGRDWIPAQIASILAQRGVAVHLLVSDDQSSDGTAALVQALGASDERVRLLASESASGSAGANFRRLFRAAGLDGFDFVALADQDDLWLPDKLAHAVRRLRDACADGYSSAATAFWPDGRERLLAQQPHQRAADFLFEGAGQGCTFVVTADLFRAVQDFCRTHAAQADALHYHDWLIYLLARTLRRTWLFDAESRIRYRQHAANEIGARGGLGAIQHRLARIRDGWYRTQIVAAIDAHAAAGGDVDPAIGSLRRWFAPGSPRGLARRVGLAAAVWRAGRRRASDRAVLVLAALAGWL